MIILRKIIAIFLCLAFFSVYAAEWVCYKNPVPRFDIVDVYSGRPVYRDGRFITGCMLSTDNLNTIDAFGQLGIKPDVALQLAKNNGLVKRDLKLVSSDDEMVNCIKSNHPAVGYLFINQEKFLVQCFKP